jgi:xanthine dehydrogenase molybdenum-binding subunit
VTTAVKPLSVVGKRLPRIDAAERVTGRAVYPADLVRSGMSVGQIKRSPHAHARILAINTAQARALPGVLAVITAADFPEIKPGTLYPFGETGADAYIPAITVMARDRVLWRGHAVAAVAAVDAYIAAQAVALIEVTYDVLPPLISIAAATAADAPLIDPDYKSKGFDAETPPPRNAGGRTVISHGDVALALKSAAAVADIDVTVDTAHQGYIEPHACVAETDANGCVTIWASTQGAFTAELQTAVLLGLPQSKLKVIPLEVGGAFGGKITVHVEPVAARLAQLTGRPVKIVTTREDVFAGGSGPAAAARIRVRLGADSCGKLIAIDGDYILDSGGLAGTPTTLMMQASAAPYQCANLHLEGWDVVTNKPRTEAYRGPGGIQAAFAMEQAIDDLALQLKLDPLSFRLKNAAVTGSRMPIGTPFPSIALTTIIERIASHPCWTSPLGTGALPRGRGLAFGYWRGTSMTSAAHVTMSGDGRPMVTMGAVDLTGTRTAMAQVAAEEFGLSISDIHVATGDTKSSGYSDVAAGSRVGRTMAAAVAQACQDALAQLHQRAAEKMQCRAADLSYARGAFRRGADGSSISLSDLMHATLTEGAIIGRGVSTKLPLGVEAGAHVCDVEVDPETGQVTILRYTAFQDVGRALNPPAVEGQIEGSVSQGLGWALTEGFDYGADGRLRNASMLDYRMPTALDLPKIATVLIETPVPDVPYGVRGVAEMPIVPVAACVGNAIRRAVGVRLTEMPMTPERVLRAIKQARLTASIGSRLDSN